MATVINPMAATLAIRRSILENQFYTDEMTIEREGEYTDPDTEITTQGRVAIAEKVPCRLSINGYPSISSFSTHKESNASIKIFTAPETDLMEGDFVTVYRNARTSGGTSQEFLLTTGKPLLYDSHKEVVMNERSGV